MFHPVVKVLHCLLLSCLNYKAFKHMKTFKAIYIYTQFYMSINTLFFSYKNTYNLAEPEDVLILAHTFS